MIPSRLDKKNIISVHLIDSVFWESRNRIVIVNIQPIIFSMREYEVYIIRKRIGIIIMRLSIAIVEPRMVSCIAFCPSPWRRYSWPGSRDKLVSSEAAPR